MLPIKAGVGTQTGGETVKVQSSKVGNRSDIKTEVPHKRGKQEVGAKSPPPVARGGGSSAKGVSAPRGGAQAKRGERAPRPGQPVKGVGPTTDPPASEGGGTAPPQGGDPGVPDSGPPAGVAAPDTPCPNPDLVLWCSVPEVSMDLEGVCIRSETFGGDSELAKVAGVAISRAERAKGRVGAGVQMWWPGAESFAPLLSLKGGRMPKWVATITLGGQLKDGALVPSAALDDACAAVMDRGYSAMVTVIGANTPKVPRNVSVRSVISHAKGVWVGIVQIKIPELVPVSVMRPVEWMGLELGSVPGSALVSRELVDTAKAVARSRAEPISKAGILSIMRSVADDVLFRLRGYNPYLAVAVALAETGEEMCEGESHLARRTRAVRGLAKWRDLFGSVAAYTPSRLRLAATVAANVFGLLAAWRLRRPMVAALALVGAAAGAWWATSRVKAANHLELNRAPATSAPRDLRRYATGSVMAEHSTATWLEEPKREDAHVRLNGQGVTFGEAFRYAQAACGGCAPRKAYTVLAGVPVFSPVRAYETCACNVTQAFVRRLACVEHKDMTIQPHDAVYALAEEKLGEIELPVLDPDIQAREMTKGLVYMRQTLGLTATQEALPPEKAAVVDLFVKLEASRRPAEALFDQDLGDDVDREKQRNIACMSVVKLAKAWPYAKYTKTLEQLAHLMVDHANRIGAWVKPITRVNLLWAPGKRRDEIAAFKVAAESAPVGTLSMIIGGDDSLLIFSTPRGPRYVNGDLSSFDGSWSPAHYAKVRRLTLLLWRRAGVPEDVIAILEAECRRFRATFRSRKSEDVYEFETTPIRASGEFGTTDENSFGLFLALFSRLYAGQGVEPPPPPLLNLAEDLAAGPASFGFVPEFAEVESCSAQFFSCLFVDTTVGVQMVNLPGRAAYKAACAPGDVRRSQAGAIRDTRLRSLAYSGAGMPLIRHLVADWDGRRLRPTAGSVDAVTRPWLPSAYVGDWELTAMGWTALAQHYDVTVDALQEADAFFATAVTAARSGYTSGEPCVVWCSHPVLEAIVAKDLGPCAHE